MLLRRYQSLIYFNPQEPSSQHGIGKHVVYLSLNKACLMVIKCLSLERDYQVLTLVLEDVPLVLQNKAVHVLYGNNIKVIQAQLNMTDNKLMCQILKLFKNS